MKAKHFLHSLATALVLLFGVSFRSSAQTTGQLSISGASGSYTVYYTPTTAGTFYGGSIVGITAPTGSTALGTPTSINGTWEIASMKAPQGGLDYWAYSNSATVVINASQVGTAIPLFSIASSGACAGGSFNINPSNNTIIGGFDYSSYLDNSGATPANTGVINTNSALCSALTQGLSCGSGLLSPSNFIVGTPSTATYTVGVQNLVANTSYNFTETTGANFSTNPGTFSYIATGAETTVAIPVAYDGSGAAGTTQTLTFSLSGASTTCTATATITNAVNACGSYPAPTFTVN